jgi:DnaJ-class molecular chaperone
MPCDRCGGTGRFPSSRFDGVCLKCGGSREIADRRARKPRVVSVVSPEPIVTQAEIDEASAFLMSWMG